jgi:hypothetical protein
MKKITINSLLALCLIGTATVTAQQSDEVDGTMVETGTVVYATTSSETPAPATQNRGALVWDNGPHFNIPGSPNISQLQNTTLGQTTLGGGVSGAFSIADDFTLTATYDISSVDLYGYQTGAPTSPASISGVVIQIWDGDPSGSGSIIYGDFTTNVITGAAWSDTYRESETTPGTNRAIYLVNADLSGLQLGPGTYWMDWQFIGDGAFSGPWQPPVVELNVVVPGNALQSNTGVYAAWEDGGSFDPLDAPFQIYGTEVLGVGDASLETGVSIYPNPAQNILNISNSSNITLLNAQVYTIQGRLLQSVDLSDMGSEKSLDVSSYAAGVYVVNITGESGSVSKRFVKR